MPRSIDIGLLESLFDMVPEVAFFVKDAHGRYLAVNNSLVARHGLKRKSDAYGKRPNEICSGEFGQIPSRQDIEVLRSGRPLIEHVEMQWHRPNEPVWCITTKLPIRGDQNEVIGLIGFSRDIRAQVSQHEIPPRFALALEAFERDLASDMTPARLAMQAGLSRQRLSRLTMRYFGVTPGQFITNARLTAAARMLRETDQTVSEIAHSCGFYDHSAFARAFRSATGVTPSAYRNEPSRSDEITSGSSNQRLGRRVSRLPKTGDGPSSSRRSG
jgi:AraC-like DNA-binding protein